ncbi:MAG: response regulator [Candidatus Adiutricales bacterium]
MKVLLVDDEEKFISRLAERLSIRGMEADWVTTGEEALLKARMKSYDVAILDVKMPHIGGIELKKRLEKIDPEMKFIMVTGHGSEDNYKVGSREASFYIIKPFKIDTLVDKIKRAQTLSG